MKATHVSSEPAGDHTTCKAGGRCRAPANRQPCTGMVTYTLLICSRDLCVGVPLRWVALCASLAVIPPQADPVFSSATTS